MEINGNTGGGGTVSEVVRVVGREGGGLFAFGGFVVLIELRLCEAKEERALAMQESTDIS